MGELSLGPCCACRRDDETVKNIVMLDLKAPELGRGWGCVVCGLDPDGAYAVLCNNCMAGGIEPTEVVSGYPAEGGRAPIASCGGAHCHDMAKHADDELPCDGEDGRYDDGEDGEDGCGRMPDGTCLLAGTEYCDWDFPFSH